MLSQVQNKAGVAILTSVKQISEQRMLLGITGLFHKDKGVNSLGGAPIINFYLLT